MKSMAIVLVTLFVVFLHIAFSFASYTIIVEKAATWESESFPISDSAVFSVDYATPNQYPADAKALVILDMRDTGFVHRFCSVAGGAMEDADYYSSEAGYTYVRVDTTIGTTLQFTCTYDSPAIEQPAKLGRVWVWDWVDSSQWSADLSEAAIAFESQDSLLLEKFFSKTGMYSGSPFTIAPVYTQAVVTGYTYKFISGPRVLFNDTEIVALRQFHHSYLRESSSISLDDVYVLDHYVTPKTSSEPQYTSLVLYTLHRSEYDYTSNVRASRPRLQASNAFTPALQLASLGPTLARNIPYYSYCYKSQTLVESLGKASCGTDDCGHCTSADSPCTTNTECATGVCLATGVCQIEYGTRPSEVSSAYIFTKYSSYITTILLITITYIIMV